MAKKKSKSLAEVAHMWTVSQNPGREITIKKVGEPEYPQQLFVRATPEYGDKDMMFRSAANPGGLGVRNRVARVAVYEYKGMVDAVNKTTLRQVPKKKPAKKKGGK